MLKVYAYKNCSTCRNALKWLVSNDIKHEIIAIRETPPAKSELKAALSSRPIGKLFNTSGQDYRALSLKDKLPKMPESDAIALLAENGNLVKRPFAIDKKAGVTLVGFKEDEWSQTLT